MGLARESAGLGRAVLGGWRSQFDFDASGLAVRQRLERLEYAATQAARRYGDEGEPLELGFALSECRELLEMGSLEGEAAEQARVRQRMERVRRVVLHHEGQLSRLNRRFWWIPCSVGLVVMACCLAQYVVAL